MSSPVSTSSIEVVGYGLDDEQSLRNALPDDYGLDQLFSTLGAMRGMFATSVLAVARIDGEICGLIPAFTGPSDGGKSVALMLDQLPDPTIFTALISFLKDWDGGRSADQLLLTLINPDVKATESLNGAGFVTASTMLVSTLPLTGELSPVPDVPGVVITPLSDSTVSLERVFELWVEAHQGIPDENFTSTAQTVDEWLGMISGSDGSMPEACFVATDGDAPVGITFWMQGIALPGEDLSDYTSVFTGVASAWRGRGVATALKLHAFRWAQQQEAKQVHAFNHADNTAIMAVNSKLGFQPKTTMGTYVLPR